VDARPDVIELSKLNGNSLSGCKIWNKNLCKFFCLKKLFSSYISEVVLVVAKAGSNRANKCSLKKF
jgi:hypothetical protein